MNNKKSISLPCLALLLVLSTQTQAQKPMLSLTDETAIQNAILVQINQYRLQHGMHALKMDSRITREAKQHSLDMARHKMPFGHQYFNTRIKRLHAQIYHSNAAAENVAYNYKSAEDVVNNWLKSSGHKQNIRGHYDLTGIGVVKDAQGKMYFTQIFLRA